MNSFRLALLLLLAVSLARASELAALPSIGFPSREAVASWYGIAHEGRKTASGTVFLRHKLTAAHRTAVFGTRYLVFYKDQVVEVTVNDRGPYIKRQDRYSRDLDLSEGAARSLGLAEIGVARVSLRVIEYPHTSEVDANQLLPRTLRPRQSSTVKLAELF